MVDGGTHAAGLRFKMAALHPPWIIPAGHPGHRVCQTPWHQWIVNSTTRGLPQLEWCHNTCCIDGTPLDPEPAVRYC